MWLSASVPSLSTSPECDRRDDNYFEYFKASFRLDSHARARRCTHARMRPSLPTVFCAKAQRVSTDTPSAIGEAGVVRQDPSCPSATRPLVSQQGRRRPSGRPARQHRLRRQEEVGVVEEGWSWGCETYAREGERDLKARAWRRQVRTERRERRRERALTYDTQQTHTTHS